MPSPDPRRIVIFSGSGVSAESGLPTFRDSGGLWRQYAWEEVASPEGWRKHPEVVQAFYNERRQQAAQARPNAAHRAIAELEKAYDVVVVTQNVDDLHERAG
ncbi:MAG: Sir2 family NAD-dependent protein deacetylase, partial [Variovorax sp.]